MFKNTSLFYVTLIWLCSLVPTVMTGALGTCRSDNACGKDYCCAFRVSHNAGFCMPTRGLGDICSISYTKGRSFTCGCKEGLTCAIVDKDKRTGQEKTRCVEIPQEAREHLEGHPNNATETVVKLLTAHELRHLLDLINDKPKARKT